MSCHHTPQCPDVDATNRFAAAIIATHHDQGWVLLCNMIVIFDDTGALLPNGAAIQPGIMTPHHAAA